MLSPLPGTPSLASCISSQGTLSPPLSSPFPKSQITGSGTRLPGSLIPALPLTDLGQIASLSETFLSSSVNGDHNSAYHRGWLGGLIELL